MADILAKVKPPVEAAPGHQRFPDLEGLERELSTGTYLGWSEEFNGRMRVSPVNAWLCTDTIVGVFAYYFDGVFVALSFQSARKSGTEFCWVSEFAAYGVRECIRRLADDDFKVELIDRDEELPSFWLGD
jgi:hypothetical protein